MCLKYVKFIKYQKLKTGNFGKKTSNIKKSLNSEKKYISL